MLAGGWGNIFAPKPAAPIVDGDSASAGKKRATDSPATGNAPKKQMSKLQMLEERDKKRKEREAKAATAPVKKDISKAEKLMLKAELSLGEFR